MSRAEHGTALVYFSSTNELISKLFELTALYKLTIICVLHHRHPYPQKEAHYTYRFQVPDSDSYDVSWTNFTGEQLENYNWNFVDHYICSRGEEEFSLCEVSILNNTCALALISEICNHTEQSTQLLLPIIRLPLELKT